MAFRRSFLITFLIFSCLTIAFFFGFFVRAYTIPDSDFPILRQAYQTLKNHGLQDFPPPPAIEYGMIRGMLDAYGDPYTTFLEPAEQMSQADSLQGSFEGIGVDLQMNADGSITLHPILDGPAARAGIENGDRLIRVGELKVNSGTSLEAVQEALRGLEGQSVSLEVFRPPENMRLVIEVGLENIALPSATWYVLPQESQIGVIKINLIAASTPLEIQDAVNALQTQGVSNFILDLRDNGGGLLDSAVDIARLFLKEGMLLQQQYRDRGVETYSVEEPGPLAELPLVILVNEGTASAAEIIAGSLQAHGRAPLIGSPTYGKNSIQLVFELEDGSSLHVTAARWWIPANKGSTNENSLQPDIRTRPGFHGRDLAMEAAIRYLLRTR